jgi:hypothetical protein
MVRQLYSKTIECKATSCEEAAIAKKKKSEKEKRMRRENASSTSALQEG